MKYRKKLVLVTQQVSIEDTEGPCGHPHIPGYRTAMAFAEEGGPYAYFHKLWKGSFTADTQKNHWSQKLLIYVQAQKPDRSPFINWSQKSESHLEQLL